jgi:coiled-coil domain-containing protein 130
MSSLAATQADGFYFPPEWTPAMGGLSKYQGSKGANQYQQSGIVRFELPFDGWCLKCERHICKGHRFNAKKDKIGKYFSTTLFSFSTKCPESSCDQAFLIKTDPKNRTYDFAEGIRAMVQDFEPGANDSIIETTKEETKILLENDPMYRLQHDKVGKMKADAAKTAIERLIDLQDEQFLNDFDSNSLLRKRHRDVKHRNKELLKEGNSIGLAMALVEPSEEDSRRARNATFRPQGPNKFQARERLKMADLVGGSIFSAGASAKQSQDDGVLTKRKRESSGSTSTVSKEKRLKLEKFSAEAKRSQAALGAMRKQAVQKLDPRHFKAASGTSTGNIQHTSHIKITSRKIGTVNIEDTKEKESGQAAAAFGLMYADYESD